MTTTNHDCQNVDYKYLKNDSHCSNSNKGVTVSSIDGDCSIGKPSPKSGNDNLPTEQRTGNVDEYSSQLKIQDNLQVF